jgi:AraC family transcriptional regulator of adaptative response / DNA-3-methyladenine glycosylase II
MELQPSRCYDALRSRDPRFDGRFFLGVTTTGIYCRPICPARAPRPENVRFYPCAAAAEEAGFRPCRRCRPESSPGTPAWHGTSSTVSRALRLIEESALDHGQEVGDLAARLGLGERQLRRLFARHLGASPAAVARTRRVHFARRLIDETALPMGVIASGSGFASVRQFNHDMRRVFRSSPTVLRRARGRHDAAVDGALVVRLPYRAPYEWEAMLAYLAPRAIPGVEVVRDGSYRRTVRVAKGAGWIEVGAARGEPALEVALHLPASAEWIVIVERLRRVFDLAADPEVIAGSLRGDPLLGPLVRRRPGLRIPGAWDPFELAVRAILGQQVTVRGATTLAGRLVERFGEEIAGTGDAGVGRLFPRPADLVRAPLEQIGLPAARAEALRSLAAVVASGRLLLAGGASLEEAVGRLTALPGIGAWTAHYVALRALGEPDAFPAGDLGLRRAAGKPGAPASAAALSARAEGWRPWRGYAALHLWTSDLPAAGRAAG